MRCSLFCLLWYALSVTVWGQAPTESSAPVQNTPAIEILSFKIGNNYNPLLERQPSVVSADATGLPPTEGEKLARRASQANRAPVIYNQSTPRGIIAPEDRPDIRRIRVIDQAEWVNLELKNTGSKIIKTIEWDFAFPRYENGKLLLRYDSVSKTEIKAGSKKTLKQNLPAEARKCQLISAEAAAFELVCSKDFNDPTQLKQAVVTIKKIIYADGSVWLRP